MPAHRAFACLRPPRFIPPRLIIAHLGPPGQPLRGLRPISQAAANGQRCRSRKAKARSPGSVRPERARAAKAGGQETPKGKQTQAGGVLRYGRLAFAREVKSSGKERPHKEAASLFGCCSASEAVSASEVR